MVKDKPATPFTFNRLDDGPSSNFNRKQLGLEEELAACIKSHQKVNAELA